MTGPPIPMLARTRHGLAVTRAALAGPVVLVPTMGALHDGHRSPLRLARELAGPGGSVLVSIFVNPLQFGPLEDFDRYPRPLEQDLAVCASEGVQAVFAPGRAVIYPAEPAITVNPGELGRRLEGKSRPGFFDGVLTVVLKLLELTKPDVAVFGEKDAQQLALIRRMVTDLDLGVQIAGAPLHRDGDGLASSSRNGYLSAAERVSALALSHALAAARAAAAGGAASALQAGQAGSRRRRRGEPAGTSRLLRAGRAGRADRGRVWLRRAGRPADRGQGRPDQADRQRACERRRAAGSRARPRQAGGPRASRRGAVPSGLRSEARASRRGAAMSWTEERGTSDEGRHRLEAPRRASGKTQ